MSPQKERQGSYGESHGVPPKAVQSHHLSPSPLTLPVMILTRVGWRQKMLGPCLRSKRVAADCDFSDHTLQGMWCLAFNLSTWKVEAGGLFQGQGLPGLQSETLAQKKKKLGLGRFRVLKGKSRLGGTPKLLNLTQTSSMLHAARHPTLAMAECC